MIPEDDSSAVGPHFSGAKPYGEEKTLKSDRLQVERKTFLFTLKENPRGRFLRITEDVNGRRDTIIVPATGLDEFRRVLADMVAVTESAPPPDTA